MSESNAVLRTASPPESLRALLAGAVDYAGLFPPAKLTMEEAVAEYARVRSSPCAWMLGRFVAPVARLSELQSAIAGNQALSEDWRIAATSEASVRVADAVAEIHSQVQTGAGPHIVVEALELRACDASEIRELAGKIPTDLDCYFEIPLDERAGDCAKAARAAQRFLKARTGGPTPESTPPAAALASFITTCVENKVRFKLTAGLHHPLRAFYSLDHQPGSPPVLMHGFLNVFFAAAFALKGAQLAKLVEILKDQSLRAFRFNLEGASWREETIPNRDLRLARQIITSFGSCSFREPVEGLRGLGWL